MAPFFPRLIFVALGLDRDQWRSVNGTLGVACLVMGDDRPISVPEGFVENLMSVLNGMQKLEIGNKLHVNGNAQFRDGPFSDLICHVQNIDTKGRVKVLMELMGRPVPVTTLATMLVAAS